MGYWRLAEVNYLGVHEFSILNIASAQQPSRIFQKIHILHTIKGITRQRDLPIFNKFWNVSCDSAKDDALVSHTWFALPVGKNGFLYCASFHDA